MLCQALRKRRSILTDEKLCVLGSNGSIYAIGDAATISLPKALDHAEELFREVRAAACAALISGAI